MRLRGSLLMLGAALLAAVGMAACGGGGGIAKSSTPGVSGVHSAYVANTTSGSISEYAIDTSGILHEITGSPFKLSSGNPVALAMTPNGNFLYATDPVKNQIFAMSIDANSGVLTALNSVNSGTNPSSMAVSNNGKFLYVSNSGASNISVYAIGSDGKLTEASFSPVAVNGPVRSVTVSPKGTYLFASVPSTGDIYQFAPDPNTGALTAMAGSPMAIGSSPVYVAVSPDETFAIVLDDNSLLNRLNIASGGALAVAPNSPFISGSKPIQAAIDTTSTFIYLLNQNSNNVTILTYTQGTPRSVQAQSTGTTPAAMVLYNQANLYVTNSNDNTVAEFSAFLKATSSGTTPTGVITPLSPITLPTGTKPQGLAVR